jgi:1-pyrroline-5-carboxylate dehydrogenase
MSNAFFKTPIAINEPVKAYAPGTAETNSLIQTYKDMWSQAPIDVPMYIGGKEVRTNTKKAMNPPHDHAHVLGHYNAGDASHVTDAIESALSARKAWAELPWEERAAIFLKAADLLAGPFRNRMNAATMLAQSKNVMQAEIDAACELIDFFRFNVQYMTQIYKEQPESLPGMWNRLEYRPLEGFVFAMTPFNFTSIAANLCAAPAMMGNVVVWKPAGTQVYSAQVIMDLFKAAGLPDGVINMITVDGPVAGDIVFKHKDFAGLHFTGSTGVFRHLWKEIAINLDGYRSYPRIVGETGGKDFIMVHHSADAAEVADRDALRMTCTLNGEEVQNTLTDDLVFNVGDIVEYVSGIVELLPGDVIFTGTPGGVGVSRKPAVFLKPGDVLVSTIDGIGTTTNRCI